MCYQTLQCQQYCLTCACTILACLRMAMMSPAILMPMSCSIVCNYTQMMPRDLQYLTLFSSSSMFFLIRLSSNKSTYLCVEVYKLYRTAIWLLLDRVIVRDTSILKETQPREVCFVSYRATHPRYWDIVHMDARDQSHITHLIQLYNHTKRTILHHVAIQIIILPQYRKQQNTD